MTEGYLWTGQFEECQRVLENSNPQSMELDEKTLKGYWSTDNNKGVDFFIINDAVFSKLCILGDDVEPCFEGANVSAPNLSSQFSKDDEFTKSLFTMMSELKFALNNSEGGKPMHNEIQNELDNNVASTSFENQDNVEAPVTQFDESGEAGAENSSDSQTSAEDEIQETSTEEEGEAVVLTASEPPVNDEEKVLEDDAKVSSKKKPEEFAKEKDKEEKSETEKSEDNTEDEDKKDFACKEDEDKKDKFSLEQQLEELQTQFAALQAENAELLAFKQKVEEKEKDELIASFYMLSDEDKKDVIDNKANYSLKEIKAELSMICVDKKVNFNLENAASVEEAPVTFNLNSHQADTLPAWLKAVEATRNRNK